ncbi:uncharacterized protein FOMMEDRAFT_156641 [Fomitiporia mediterranea MF3/22]|uniref:uncharacterized protein n=1 Tax=Fomitiporia mediterranea (strain MF3/22) TaxID=694068 RepID=UPI0004408AC3|nr:uncharacterized protein FOMMEDRAFT_156641 [Fomitiporia mediterranea MF3/22]EJD03255.1 hypothetical protein FOMMEDRAFT_156641 [Fomitiporia mediterranea MF3/22]
MSCFSASTETSDLETSPSVIFIRPVLSQTNNHNKLRYASFSRSSPSQPSLPAHTYGRARRISGTTIESLLPDNHAGALRHSIISSLYPFRISEPRPDLLPHVVWQSKPSSFQATRYCHTVFLPLFFPLCTFSLIIHACSMHMLLVLLHPNYS